MKVLHPWCDMFGRFSELFSVLVGGSWGMLLEQCLEGVWRLVNSCSTQS